nr:hypothetical protein [Nanoarchaeum sp.]
MKNILIPLALTTLIGCANTNNSFDNSQIYNASSGLCVQVASGDTTLVLYNHNPEEDKDLFDQEDYARATLSKFIFFKFGAEFRNDRFTGPTGETLELRLIDSYPAEKQKKLRDSIHMLQNRFTDIYRKAVEESETIINY